MPAKPSSGDGFSGLVAFLPRALRAIWVGVFIFFLGLCGTAVWALLTVRQYRSETVIMYEPPIVEGSDSQHESPRQIGLQLQDMITSRQRLEEVIKEMNLYPELVEKRGLVEATTDMKARLTVAVREGYAYRVSFTADSRDLAQKVLARLAKKVIDDDKHRRRQETEKANLFLKAERKRADEDLKAREAALSTFLVKHPALAMEQASPGGTIRATDRERSSSSSAEIASLEIQSAQVESSLTSPVNRDAPAARVDRAVETARADLQATQRDLSEKQSRFTDEHPDVKTAIVRAKEAQAALRQAEAATTSTRVGSSDTPRSEPAQGGDEAVRKATLRRALGAIRSQISALRGRDAPRGDVPRGAGPIVAVDGEWARLSRAVADAGQRQRQLEGRQFQIELMAILAAENQAGGLAITDPAFRPGRPFTGGRFKIVLSGVAGSLVLALIAIVVAGSLDRRVYDQRDVMRAVNVDLVVVVPRLTGKVG